MPDNEVELREQIITLQKTGQALRDARNRYRRTSEPFDGALHLLTIENDNLRRDARHRPSRRLRVPVIRAIASNPERRNHA
ncbi:hypothetical protein GEO20_14805 [Rhodococcus erythropolis]|uniref:hypothetical protein n=1 Tax=Rhodococcus erythropolis TaxID=1833 RepID=UPI0012929CF8|nr:hypothetical protein [Rhodococcus erythropolis]MQP33243.1 hypothetical protein [Rhodococcus erythropolis]